MAVMTTSGSMPFSLASASMVCCNGFDIYYSGVPTPSRNFRGPHPGLASELHFQIRPRDDPDRHEVPAPILGLDDHAAVFHTAEPALEKRLPVHRLAHHQFGAASGEPAEV